jgi:hypothetical protein
MIWIPVRHYSVSHSPIIAQLNRSQLYSSRWVTVAFYLTSEQESHLPGDELRRGRTIPDIEAGQINPFSKMKNHGSDSGRVSKRLLVPERSPQAGRRRFPVFRPCDFAEESANGLRFG